MFVNRVSAFLPTFAMINFELPLAVQIDPLWSNKVRAGIFRTRKRCLLCHGVTPFNKCYLFNMHHDVADRFKRSFGLSIIGEQSVDFLLDIRQLGIAITLDHREVNIGSTTALSFIRKSSSFSAPE